MPNNQADKDAKITELRQQLATAIEAADFWFDRVSALRGQVGSQPAVDLERERRDLWCGVVTGVIAVGRPNSRQEISDHADWFVREFAERFGTEP